MRKRPASELIEIGQKMVDFLMDRGTRKPDRPYKPWATSAEIEDELKISGVAVRQVVWTMRCTGDPHSARIASGDRGYRWAFKHQQIEHTRRHLVSRGNAMRAAEQGIAMSFGEEETTQVRMGI